MKTLLSHNFPSEVTAFFSDRTMDFTLPDHPGLTETQREYLSSRLQRNVEAIVNIRQVHGDHIVDAREDILKNFPVAEADGIITDRVNFLIAVRTADCIPIFIYDPQKKCIGLVHAGWRGSQKEIVIKVLKKMREKWGCLPQNLLVTLGPGIRRCCYKVGQEFQTIFPQEVNHEADIFYLDLTGVNKNQLLRAGVREERIWESPSCTCCDVRFFSYRREGRLAGRHLSLMSLQDGGSGNSI